MRKLTYVLIIFLIIEITIPSAYGSMMFNKRGPSEEKADRESKSAVLNKAEQAFVKGDYEEVIAIGNKYVSYGKKSDDELQYIMGRALLKLNRFKEARDCFSKIINQNDSDKFLDNAYIGLADSYYLDGDYEKASENYERAKQYFPDSDSMPIVYYRLGNCYSKLGNGSASKEYYDKLIKCYPDSLEAKLLVREKSDFAVYSVQVGSFISWKNAKKLCDELKNKGFDANIYTTILGDKRFYRVRVGQCSQLSDVEDMARALRNSGYSAKIYP